MGFRKGGGATREDQKQKVSEGCVFLVIAHLSEWAKNCSIQTLTLLCQEIENHDNFKTF